MDSQEMNKTIHEYMGRQPEIEYAVGKDDWFCYSPGNLREYYPTPSLQKAECERFVKEQKDKGWMYADAEVKMLEHYPQYENRIEDIYPVWLRLRGWFYAWYNGDGNQQDIKDMYTSGLKYLELGDMECLHRTLYDIIQTIHQKPTNNG